MYCCSLWWNAFNVIYLATHGIMPYTALPLSFHQKPNISETIQIPTPKPYILFFIMIICIQWHIPCAPQGSHCFNLIFIPRPIGSGDIEIALASVCPSVCRQNLVRPIPPIPFELFSWNCQVVEGIVIKSCAGHNSITLWDIFMILNQVVEDIE